MDTKVTTYNCCKMQKKCKYEKLIKELEDEKKALNRWIFIFIMIGLFIAGTISMIDFTSKEALEILINKAGFIIAIITLIISPTFNRVNEIDKEIYELKVKIIEWNDVDTD